MVAVISLGGKQYTVEPGKIIDVSRLTDEPGQVLHLTDMLAGHKVEAKIVDHHLGEKLRIIKFKNKTRYTRTHGHRSALTKVEITKVEA